MSVRPIPEGYHTLTPYYTVEGGHRFIAFLQAAFGAELLRSHDRPDGAVANAELRLGSSMLMVSDARPGCPPQPLTMYLYVEDTDALYASALAAGASSIQPPADMFYGDRSGGVKDAWGNDWWIATHIEDMSDEELVRRAERMGQ